MGRVKRFNQILLHDPLLVRVSAALIPQTDGSIGVRDVDSVIAATAPPTNHRLGIIRRLRRFRFLVRLSVRVKKPVTEGTILLSRAQCSAIERNLRNLCNLRILFPGSRAPWLEDVLFIGAFWVGGLGRNWLSGLAFYDFEWHLALAAGSAGLVID